MSNQCVLLTKMKRMDKCGYIFLLTRYENQQEIVHLNN